MAGRGITQFDDLQAEKFFRLGTEYPGVRAFFNWITEFGAGRPLNLLVGGVTLVLLVQGQFRLALIFVASVILNRELNIFWKLEFTRLRPIYLAEEIRRGNFGFPSGHSQNAMFIYSFLTYLSFLAYPRWKWFIGTGLMLLILLIGISRMVLGVHFFTDVLCGFLMAMAFLSIWIALIEWKRSAS